jgi:hypothetical protein
MSDAASAFDVTAAASGFSGMVNRPTYFLAGEAGPEHVEITPGGRRRGGGAGGISTTFNVTVVGSDDPQRDGVRFARMAEEAIIRSMRSGRLRKVISEVVR